MGYDHGWSSVEFLGVLLAICGVVVFFAILFQNDSGKVKWHVWERWEQCVFVGVTPVAILGVVLVAMGCGTSVPEPAEPTDPVTVEVDGPTTELAPTVNFYLRLSMARVGFAACEAAQVPLEERSAIRAEARQEVQLLHDELVAYVKSGQTGEYCGPVCEEMFNFLVNVDESICEE